jgi:hypothetical protein
MADIDLTVTIPDSKAVRVQEAFNGMANNKIQMQFDNINHEFIYDERQNGETNKEYAQRILRELAKSLIKIYELDKDFKERYIPEIKAVQEPAINVPNDILT